MARPRVIRPIDPAKMEPMLPCFSSPEAWLLFCSAAQDSLHSGAKLTRKRAAQMACDDCNVYDQFILTLKGRCQPVEGAITPRDRERLGLDGDADE